MYNNVEKMFTSYLIIPVFENFSCALMAYFRKLCSTLQKQILPSSNIKKKNFFEK